MVQAASLVTYWRRPHQMRPCLFPRNGILVLGRQSSQSKMAIICLAIKWWNSRVNNTLKLCVVSKNPCSLMKSIIAGHFPSVNLSRDVGHYCASSMSILAWKRFHRYHRNGDTFSSLCVGLLLYFLSANSVYEHYEPVKIQQTDKAVI